VAITAAVLAVVKPLIDAARQHEASTLSALNAAEITALKKLLGKLT
jgi:hypothetical protein